MAVVCIGIREWFRWYKTPDGKPLNAFGYGERCLDSSQAIDIIEETHASWTALVNGEVKDTKGLWVHRK